MKITAAYFAFGSLSMSVYTGIFIQSSCTSWPRVVVDIKDGLGNSSLRVPALCNGRGTTIVCLGANGCSGRLMTDVVEGDGHLCGGVTLVLEDCYIILRLWVNDCSGSFMIIDVVAGCRRFDGGVTPIFAKGDCCTLFCGPPVATLSVNHNNWTWHKYSWSLPPIHFLTDKVVVLHFQLSWQTCNNFCSINWKWVCLLL